jgi:hypothetical protein
MDRALEQCARWLPKGEASLQLSCGRKTYEIYRSESGLSIFTPVPLTHRKGEGWGGGCCDILAQRPRDSLHDKPNVFIQQWIAEANYSKSS